MDFLNSLFLPPSSDHLHLVKYMVLLIYLIHIPFISLMMGGTFFSLIFRVVAGSEKNSLYHLISQDLVNILVFRKMAGIFLGVLPLIVLVFLEGQIFYDANVLIVRFLLYTTVLVSVGIMLIYFYQYSYRNPEIDQKMQIALGGLGLFFLFAGYFIFSAATSLLLDPGRWGLVRNAVEMLFSWNVIARFLQLFTAAFAVSGAAFIFLFFNWKETRLQMDPPYAEYVRRFGGGVVLGFTLIQPVFIIWNLRTMPDMAQSALVFAFSVIAIFLIMLLSLRTYRLLREADSKLGTGIFVLFLLTFLVMIANDHSARENAIENHTALLVARADEIESKLRTEREAERETGEEIDLVLGESVFRKQCSSCHKFDQKLVGPPYLEVLPKYRDKKEQLIRFVKNPQKINPDYPPMPNLGLKDNDVRSVVEYLFQEWEKNQ